MDPSVNGGHQSDDAIGGSANPMAAKKDQSDKWQLVQQAKQNAQATPALPFPVEILTESQLEAPLNLDDDPIAEAITIADYHVIGEISRGGQAVVLEATAKSTGRRVAIKVMRGGPFATTRERLRFEREVKILASLKHPNIVGILDRGITSDGSFYLVMDYIAGQTLGQFMAQYRQEHTAPSDFIPLLKLFIKILNAVSAAHDSGIIHRDLKPSNVRLNPDAEPFLLDFGLARVPGSTSADSMESHLTSTGQFVGSLAYASPEQAEGQPNRIDARSDVYALGVILYQMLTGQFPYKVAGPMHEVVQNILKTEPTPPSQVIAAEEAKGVRRKWRLQQPKSGWVDETLEAVVLKALSKSPEDRYRTAGELAKDITSYMAGLPTMAVPKRIGRGLRRIAAVACIILASGVATASWLTVRSTPSSTGLSQATSAPADAYEFHGHGYKAIKGQFTWDQAKRAAEQMGGHLAVIHDESELRFTSVLMGFGKASFGRPDNYWWIGLESDGANRLRAVDGSHIEYKHFAPGPKQADGLSPVCTKGNLWYLEHPLKRFGMIVEWDRIPANTLKRLNEAPPDAVEFNGKKYKLFENQVTRAEAIALCSREGGGLICIESADEEAFITSSGSLGKKTAEAVWMGAVVSGGRISWANGSASQFTRWAKATNLISSENDGLLWTPDGWVTTNLPDRRAGYLCEWKSKPFE